MIFTHWSSLCDSSLFCSSSLASGLTKPYASRMPRNVPTSAPAIICPSTAGGCPTEAIVFTTPSTAATMPNAGRPSPTAWIAPCGLWASWWCVSISLSIRFSISCEFMLPDTIIRR